MAVRILRVISSLSAAIVTVSVTVTYLVSSQAVQTLDITESYLPHDLHTQANAIR
jgi:hypothetical protein